LLINKSIPLLGFTTLLILSTVIVNSAAAQLPTKTIGIKITSPAKGQPVSLAGNDLKISGIASHNGTLACKVYVIVNDMKPYQTALPTGGHNNTNDYSTWVFTLVPTYTTIKTGTNKITSKLACQENNANTSKSSTLLTKFYSINVTGAPISTMKQQGQSLKNSSNTKVGNNSLNATKTQSGIEKKHSPISNNTKTSGSIPTKSQQLNSKLTKTNATKTNAMPVNGAKNNNNNNNANVTGQTGNGSQQANQMTSVSAAALLSTTGILSTHQGNAETSGTTNANIDHGHQKGTASKSSSGQTSTTTTKTNDNSLNNKASAESGRQQNNPSTNTNVDNNNAKSLSVSMHIAKRPVHVGDKENLTLGVTDSNRTHVVAGASVFGSITDPSGISKKLAGTTNEKGKVSYSWQVSGDNTSGKYKVIMETSAPGYQNNSVSKTFTVVPIPIASSNNSSSASSHLRNINNNNNDNNVTTSKQIASPPPTVTPPTVTPSPSPSVIVATSSTTKSSNNHNSPLISSKQNPTRLALQGSVSNQSGRVYIPSTTSTTLNNPTVPPITNSFRSFESGRVSIPNPGHNINIPAISNKVNVPNPQTNGTKSPVNQGISPIQKPQLPSNNDKIPFVIATPLLHITNGTSTPASNQLSSTMALDLVDRMRVIGFDSGMSGPASGVSVSSTPPIAIPQKSTVFIPSVK
jgi:hypothetical protein